MTTPTPAMYIGLDVGKSDHHAVAITAAGATVYDMALPKDETRLRAILGELTTHGPVLLVVDQPATIGALPVAVASDVENVQVAYLPGWPCAGSRTCTPAPRRPMPVDGIAPATRRSGTSIRGEHAPRGGNKHMKRA